MPVMKRVCLCSALAVVLAGIATLSASGPVGIFGIVEKVVFEPNEASADRIQVWGAFAYVEGGTGQPGSQTSPARKGYLYFRLNQAATAAERELVRKEWADLKSVAGTGQAVGFGRWFYIGGFGGLDPSVRSATPPTIYEMAGGSTDVRVRLATESPSAPALYQTNTGVVKVAEQGNYATLVKQLKAALSAR